MPFLSNMTDVTLIISYDILQRKDLKVYGVKFTIKSYKESANKDFLINQQNKSERFKDAVIKSGNYPIVIVNPEFNNCSNLDDGYNHIQIAYIKKE